jgi:putative transposase
MGGEPFSIPTKSVRFACNCFWQNLCYSCPLDEIHQWAASAYVERNPVRAGMVSQAEDYAWSSVPMRLSGSDTSGFLDSATWTRCYVRERRRDILATGIGEEAEWKRIRLAVRTSFKIPGCD